MDFHSISGKGAAHIMTTHRAEHDETPLQLISVERLRYFEALEQGLRAMLALVDPLPHVADKSAPDCNADCSTPA